MTKRVVLTGATGAIGSALLPELLVRGFAVTCLIRPKGSLRLDQRLGSIASHPNLRCIAGDIGKPDCGMSSSDMPGEFDAVIHAAADTRLEQRGGADRHAVNHQGTINTLRLASALRTPEFHYVGTAYIAGTANTLAEHDVGVPIAAGIPRNPYEASKLAAEQQVRAWDGKVSIYRPSIVVGRADDGLTHGLHGIYAFFKAAWRLHTTLCSGNYRDGLGRRITRATPIHISPGVALDQALNLVPIDWLATTLAALMTRPASGRCYNLVHHDDTRLSDLMLAAFEAMDMGNVVVSDRSRVTLSPAVAAANRAVRGELERFRPYLAGAVRFEASRTYSDLGPGWQRPPAIDADFIRRTIAVAMSEWVRETQPVASRRTV